MALTEIEKEEREEKVLLPADLMGEMKAKAGEPLQGLASDRNEGVVGQWRKRR